MAGSERRSYRCSSESLFENAIYALCPSPHYVGGDLLEDMALLCEVVATIGALPRYMEAPEHDRAVATISHLPHVIATTLVNTAARESEQLIQCDSGLDTFSTAVDCVEGDPPACSSVSDDMPPLPSSILDLAARRFRDITRIASSDSDLWTVLSRFAEKLLPVIDRFNKNYLAFERVLPR